MFIVRFCNVVISEAYISSSYLVDIVKYECSSIKKSLHERRTKEKLKEKMNRANSFGEWKDYADQYDKFEDISEWRQNDESFLYDWKYIRHLTRLLRELRDGNKYLKLMHVIRSHPVRNLGNILDSTLYLKAFNGTKVLIEEFQKEMITCIEYIATVPNVKLSKDKKIEFFAETRHAFGRSALVLSGGASLGQYHYGVIKCLIEEDLLPRVVSGSSVGSIFASLLCTKTKAELEEFKDFSTIKVPGYFEQNQKEETLGNRLKRLMTKGYLMNYEDIRNFLHVNIGNITFQEAYDRTGWILNITVTGQDEHDGYRLLNYLTAPNVLIWSAACASCAVPYIFASVDLLCKDENGEIVSYIPESTKRYVDGTLTADVPTKDLSEMFNVNCLIVSQVNPMITIFLNHGEKFRHSALAYIFKIFEPMKYLIGSEFQHRIHQLVNLRIIPKAIARYSTIFTQQYSGNVTIWPTPTLTDLIHVLDHPNHRTLKRGGILGARGAYFKLNQVKAVLGIERALNKAYAWVRQSRDLSRAVSADYLTEEIEPQKFLNNSGGVFSVGSDRDSDEIQIQESQPLMMKSRLYSLSIPRLSSTEYLALGDSGEKRTFTRAQTTD